MLTCPVLAFAASTFEVGVERGVSVKMRDGVTLRADIYRPKADGKFPVLLERTPYDKGGGGNDFGMRGAASGYVVIIQDVRGRFTSEGEWYPFLNESQDGYDTVEWAAALPYSNGKVGMFGGSYVGATQMLTAIAQPPHLAGVFPVVTASNYHDGWTYQGGAFEQWFSQSWTSGLARDTLNRRVQKNTNAMKFVWKLPLSSYPLFEAGSPQELAGYFAEWLKHPNYDAYWKRWSIEDQHSKITVPAYSVGGWYDIFMGGTLRNYAGLKSHHNQKLMIGPWYHGPFNGKAGDLDFGPNAKGDTDELILRWYDHLLRGVANGIEKEKPVKIFVMGRNVWREEDDWPLARARAARYYLHSDHNLSAGQPVSDSPDGYVYDPAEPVPTRGGGLCCDNDHLPSGAFDQRPNEARSDVLVYTTPAFSADFEVTGPVSLELYASSSAVDTDFTAKLVDVWPNGYAQNLTDGIIRARYRNSQEKPEFMNAGEVYKFTVDMWATSNVFLSGHKLRLEVSSSNFPRFNRNPNTGEEPGETTRMVKAENKIYHDREHPSALILPVVE